MISGNVRAILVDDEMTSLENLRQKLEEFCKQVTVIAALQKPEEAITIIRDLRPDIIFLDIEMPKMNGFRMLEELENYEAEVIFTTAYNQYAINAMHISAFDYLVKPVSIEELEHAVSRLINKKVLQTKERLNVLKNSMAMVKSQDTKIAVPLREGLEFILIKDIIRIEASASYSRIYTTNNKFILVTKLLKEFEELLVPYEFFRVHNGHLVNMHYIKKYFRGPGGQVLMENGDLIDVSRRRKDEFIRMLNL